MPPRDLIRDAAIAAGEPEYWNGRPCIRGHLGPKSTKHGKCIPCWHDRYHERIARDEKFVEYVREQSRKNRTKDPRRAAAWTKKYEQKINADPEKRQARQDRINERRRERWRSEERYALGVNARRRAARIRRVVSWANEEEIKNVYLNCPDGYEVDHEVPLQGKIVSGLHVESNLQYLTISENRSKHAKFDQEEFSRQEEIRIKKLLYG